MRLFEGTPFDRPPHCERCGEPEEQCTCPPPVPTRLPPERQLAKLSIEKRGKGKRVTVLRGLSAPDTDLPELLTRLKSACGAGERSRTMSLKSRGRNSKPSASSSRGWDTA